MRLPVIAAIYSHRMALDVYLSATSNRLNEVMRALTLISTIFLPLTFITGLFGMNFDHIPGAKSWWGFYLTIGASVLVGAGMFIYFKLKKWI